MTTELTIKKSAELIELENGITALIMFANTSTITDLATKKLASDNLGYLKSAIKRIEERKLEITSPYRDAVSTFNNQVKLILEPAEVALKSLNKKFIDYVTEQERVAREQAEAERRAEIARIEAEAKLLEQAMIDTAESVNDPELINEAIQQQADAQARIEAIKNQEIIVETSSARGSNFSTGVRYLPRAKVIDPKAAMIWAANTERYELFEVVSGPLNVLAKTKLGNDTTQKIVENGIEYYYEATTGTR
jgi:hypothetical protein